MPTDDTASAARRVADWITRHPGNAEFTCLLPILDAVAAMPETDEARVGRLASVFRLIREKSAEAVRCGMCDPEDCICTDRAFARAAIALADAERAANFTL